jgi:hypothetical protein
MTDPDFDIFTDAPLVDSLDAYDHPVDDGEPRANGRDASTKNTTTTGIKKPYKLVLARDITVDGTLAQRRSMRHVILRPGGRGAGAPSCRALCCTSRPSAARP